MKSANDTLYFKKNGRYPFPCDADESCAIQHLFELGGRSGNVWLGLYAEDKSGVVEAEAQVINAITDCSVRKKLGAAPLKSMAESIVAHLEACPFPDEVSEKERNWGRD